MKEFQYHVSALEFIAEECDSLSMLDLMELELSVVTTEIEFRRSILEAYQKAFQSE